MRRAPALTATVLVTFALGIGSTTAVFSVVHGMLLRPLPYADPERLVQLWEEHPGGTPMANLRRLSNRTAAAWLQDPKTIETLGAYYANELTVLDGDEFVRLPASWISPSVFAMLRTVPAAGRLFQEEDARRGAAKVVVLAHSFWRERYGASPDALGRTLTIDGDPHTIVGVAGPSFTFPDGRARLWIPYTIPPVDERGTSIFNALGRLRPASTPAQAAAEGTAAARSMPRPQSAELIFGKGGPPVVHARPLAEDMTAPVRPALLVLAGAVLLLLLISCANVANLLLSRGLARERELAVRMALGATRTRLMAQLLTESALLSIAGGLLGLLLAWWLVRLLPAIAPDRLPRLADVRVDGVVLAFSFLASLLAGLLSGLVPALRAGRFGLHGSTRTADGAAAGSQGDARRLRATMSAVEVALAVVLAIAASLVVRSFSSLLNVEAGYRADGVLTAAVRMPRGATPEHTAAYLDATLPRIAALPAVTAAGAGSMIPLSDLVGMTTFSIPERIAAGKPSTPRALTYVVTPAYAEALALQVMDGRFFEERDVRSGVRPVVVNEEFVRQYIGVQPVVGLRLGPLYRRNPGVETELIGVVANTLRFGNDTRPEPEIYFLHQSGDSRIDGYINFVARTAGSPAGLAAEVRAILRGADRSAIIDRVQPMAALVARSVARPRFGMTIVSAFAVLALLLAAVGLYGVLSYSVSRRRREMGIRAALGADRARLVGLVLREAGVVLAAGVAAGIAGAAVLTRFMQSLLFGVSALDAVSYAAGPCVLVAAALLAAIVPAWRAAATDPAVALRE